MLIEERMIRDMKESLVRDGSYSHETALYEFHAVTAGVNQCSWTIVIGGAVASSGTFLLWKSPREILAEIVAFAREKAEKLRWVADRLEAICQ